MEDLKKESHNETVFGYVKLLSHLKSDAYPGYIDLNNLVAKRTSKIMPTKEDHTELPFMDCATENLKRWIHGIFHHVSEKYLQNYLDELVYTLNRRNFKRSIGHLLNASLVRPRVEY